MNYKEAGLRESEYLSLKKTLGREPNELELRIMGVMWSEHCSYKSTRPLLKKLPKEGKYVVLGPGENAGIIDGGDNMGIAFKVESHNHPSAVAPYQGAATGVGGIIRDIIALGARPVASLDGLFFGSPQSPVHQGVVSGIGGYGNCIGVPTIGGKTCYDPSYEGNPLVNAMNIGTVRLDKIVSSQTAKPGQAVVILGSKTGRDGIAGAAFASAELKDNAKESRPSIQIGDPFVEKLLTEACLEMRDQGLFVSMQDMGAAGILSSSSEVAAKSGVAMTIDFDKVPLRAQGMEAWEIALSESQERMLLIVEDAKMPEIKRIAEKWGLDATEIGRTEEGDHYRIYWKGKLAADIPATTIGSDCPTIDWPAQRPDLESRWNKAVEIKAPQSTANVLRDLLGDANLSCKEDIYVQYDSSVQTNTVVGPGSPVSVFRVTESGRLCAVSMEADPWSCELDPERGTANLVARTCRALSVAGAVPAGLTNCLNFPSPEKPRHFWVLSRCVEAMAEACRQLDCPVVSGNVSLYNETSTGAILPTPLLGTVGMVEAPAVLKSGQWHEGDRLFLAGWNEGTLAAGVYQRHYAHDLAGRPVEFVADRERAFNAAALATAKAQAARSGRPVMGGGLLTALAKEAIQSGVGAEIDLSDRSTAALFGEGGTAAVYAVPAGSVEAFRACWKDVPLQEMGQVSGNSLTLNGESLGTVEALNRAYRNL